MTGCSIFSTVQFGQTTGFYWSCMLLLKPSVLSDNAWVSLDTMVFIVYTCMNMFYRSQSSQQHRSLWRKWTKLAWNHLLVSLLIKTRRNLDLYLCTFGYDKINTHLIKYTVLQPKAQNKNKTQNIGEVCMYSKDCSLVVRTSGLRMWMHQSLAWLRRLVVRRMQKPKCLFLSYQEKCRGVCHPCY